MGGTASTSACFALVPNLPFRLVEARAFQLTEDQYNVILRFDRPIDAAASQDAWNQTTWNLELVEGGGVWGTFVPDTSGAGSGTDLSGTVEAVDVGFDIAPVVTQDGTSLFTAVDGSTLNLEGINTPVTIDH